MELVRDFEHIDKNDVAIAGGKGASLGEMTKAGISVPEGFVILSNVFENFLEETDLNVEIEAILDSVNHKEIHTVENASEKINALILQAEIPQDIATEIQKSFKNLNSKYVAVRSSATAEDSASAAWAGQLESYLNTIKENVLENVKKCWTSLFTPRAIFYRFEKGLHKQKISVAVVIQKMVESEKSGVAFSVHPVTEDKNQIIIEAGFGLGEAIVSGQITPDSYVIEKEPRRIIDKNIETQSRGLYRVESGGNEWREIPKEQGQKQTLSDKEILELSEIILRIENHYDFPCDIEWAFEGGKFYITQSRPITTLSEVNEGSKIVKILNQNYKIDLINYTRLFSFDGPMPYLFSYDFVKDADWLNYLSIGNKTSWISYIHNDSVLRANQEGLELYGSQKKYKEFFDGLYKANTDVRKFIENLQSKNLLSKEDVGSFFALVTKYRWHYTRTEFFFTDLAFEKKDEIQDINTNFGTFENLKLDGRKFLNEILLLPNSCLNTFLNIVSTQFDIPVTELNLYSPLEISNLFDGYKLTGKEVSERSIYIHYIYNEKFVDVQEYSAQKEIFELKNTKQDSIINGKTAFGGKVTAKARVIKIDIRDYDKVHQFVDAMEQGEVLVTETTEPSIILACQKASAIITNQGGMMSHAAIIAREMKIPCIVGTAIATTMIKTGDMVEVDADNGIIRIL